MWAVNELHGPSYWWRLHLGFLHIFWGWCINGGTQISSSLFPLSKFFVPGQTNSIRQEKLHIGNTHFVYSDEIIFPFCFCSEKPVSFQNPHPFYFAVRNKTLWIITLFPKISWNVVLCSFLYLYRYMYRYILYVLYIYRYSGSYSGRFCCQLHSALLMKRSCFSGIWKAKANAEEHHTAPVKVWGKRKGGEV